MNLDSFYNFFGWVKANPIPGFFMILIPLIGVGIFSYVFLMNSDRFLQGKVDDVKEDDFTDLL